jgi:hypothetical protein
VEDDVAAIRNEVVACFRSGRPDVCRSEYVTGFLHRLAEIDATEQATSDKVAAIYKKGSQHEQ